MAKKKPPKPQGLCVFCGGTRLTKEHIWSDWLKRHIPRGEGHVFASAGYLHDSGQQSVTSTEPLRQEVNQGSAMQRKVRRVCADCNNGWMCRTVERAKPTVLRMLKGESFQATAADLEGLAAWFALCVVMEDQGNVPRSPAIVPEDLTSLIGGNPPRANWAIWAANYCGEELRDFNQVSFDSFGTRNLVEDGTTTGSVTHYMKFTTLVVGSLVLHAIVSTREDMTAEYRADVFAYPVTLPVWPSPAPVTFWPPRWGMLDPDIDHLIYGWLRRKMKFPGLTFPRQRFPDRLQHLFNSFVIDA